MYNYLQNKIEKALDSEKFAEVENKNEIFDIWKKISDNFISIRKDIYDKFKFRLSSTSNVLVIYHNADLDGHSVKILTDLYFNSTCCIGCNVKADEAYEFIKENYNNFDYIFIADLSFTEEIASYVELLDQDNKIALFDHHASAVFLNQYDWAYVKPHSDDDFVLSSGCLLFWIFLISKGLRNDEIDDFVVSKFIFAVASYDTYLFKSENKSLVEALSLINKKLAENINTLFKSSNKQKIDDIIVENLYKGEIINSEQYLKLDTMNSILYKDIYRAYHNISIITNSNKEKIVLLFANNNASDIGNFILTNHPEFKFFAMVDLNNKTVSYRSRKDYNVSEIAIKNGGGGHQQACGCPIKEEYTDIDFNLICEKYLDVNHPFKVQKIKDIMVFNPETMLYQQKE